MFDPQYWRPEDAAHWSHITLEKQKEKGSVQKGVDMWGISVPSQ